MLHFSLSSLVMAIIFSNLLLILLTLIFKKNALILRVGYQLLLIFLGVIFLRFLFPVEIAASTNILLPEWISQCIIWFKSPLLHLGSAEISPWHIFIFIWIAGALFQAIRLLLSYQKFYRTFCQFGKDITQKTDCQQILTEVCSAERKSASFKIKEIPGNFSPMAIGLFKPMIILPEHLEQQDLYYILCHETAHYFKHDLWLIFISQCLCVLYWWNPFVYLLKDQITTILELQTDSKITKKMTSEQTLEYMNCLLKIGKRSLNQTQKYGIGICKTDFLVQRIHLLANESQLKSNRKIQTAFSVIVGTICLFSVLFIFEPHYMSPEHAKGTFELTPENAYIIQNTQNTYDIYHKNQYIATISEILDQLKSLPVYSSKEEVLSYYE